MLTIRDPEATPELRAHHATLTEYLEGLRDPESLIETQEQAQFAADMMNDIKRRAKELEAVEKHLSFSFLEGLDKIKALFRPARQAAREAEQLLKAKIQDSNKRRAEETSRALRETQAAVQRGDQAAAQAAIVRIQPVEKLAGVTVRKVWKFRVVNVNQVPVDYWQINETAVRDSMRAMVNAGQTPEIPGVEFYQEESLAATG